MRVDRRAFILAALGAAACSRRMVSADTPLGRAVAYLWAQQAPDGGFHSSTYGLLRSGQSLTPFILDTLLEVADSELRAPRGAIDRAVEFIRHHTNADGSLGQMDETVADYPNYATALAVRALVQAQREGWKEAIESMVAHLRLQQFSEAHGWEPGDAPYGAWGMGGPIHRPPDAGHVDLSMTRFVLEAMAAAGVPPSDPLFERALVYLKKSQNPDGGFYFSLVNEQTNKAGRTDDGFLSYGSSTADGLLALRATGIAESDPRIESALDWLKRHHRPDCVPGFEESPYKSWAQGLRFYYAGAVARAVPELPVELPEQQANGSFRNESNLVKEDDPLIATTFAVKTLGRV